MIKGNYDIYDIAPDGTRTLVAKSSNAVIASSWNIPFSGEIRPEDIVLIKDFGSGVDLRKVLAEKRIIRAFARDISRLEQDVISANATIADMEVTKGARQKELDDTLAEIEALRQEIVDSEQLINENG
jgi:predicted RNA-binding protein